MIEFPGSNGGTGSAGDYETTTIPGTPGTIPLTKADGKIHSQFINQGPGSELNSDKVDGLHAADLLDWNNTTNKPSPNITLIGDVSGTVNLLELMSGELYTTVKDNSHKHTVENVTGLSDLINTKISIDKIVNNLTTSDSLAPLSAEQGVVLKGLIDSIQNYLNTNADDIALIQTVVDFVRDNQIAIDNLSISNINGLQAALDNKVDNSRVLTDVPAQAVFTDTVYDDTRLNTNVESLQEVAHTHTNADILNATSAVYTGPKDDLVATIPFLTDNIDILQGNIGGHIVKTDVPANAVFTDTIYQKPTSEPITYIDGLRDALDSKVGNNRVKTDVPANAVFTDTVYDDSLLVSKINENTAQVLKNSGDLSDLEQVVIVNKNKLNGIENNATADQTKEDIDALNIDAKTVNGFNVNKSVPANAVFTDTIYDLPIAEDNKLGGILSGEDIVVDSNGYVSVKNNSHYHKISNVTGLEDELNNKVNNSRVLTDVPLNALFTDTIYNDSDIQNKMDAIKRLVNIHRTDISNLESSVGSLENKVNINTEKLNNIEDGATGDLTKSEIEAMNIDARTVNGFSVNIDVPADAVFTDNDTIYELPVANNNVLGGVRGGGDVSINNDGTMVVDKHSHDVDDIGGLQGVLDNINNEVNTDDITGLRQYVIDLIEEQTSTPGTGTGTGTDGYIELGNGMYLQYGYISNQCSYKWRSVFFENAYDNACIGVWVQGIGDTDNDKLEVKSMYYGGFQIKGEWDHWNSTNDYVIWYSLGY